MPRRRRPDQGPPAHRTRNACNRCKEKRYKCSEERPCTHCVTAKVTCVTHSTLKRRAPTVLADSSAAALTNLCSIPVQVQKDVQELARDESTRGSLDSSSTNAEVALQSMDSFLNDPIFLSRPSTPTTSSLLTCNSLYRELWYHFTEVLSCLHSPHELSSNPIVKVLSPVAQSHDPLLAVLLASSLENYCSLRGQEPDEELLGTLIGTAVTGVQRELSGTNITTVTDATLATVIALCDFEIVARKRATTSSWRIHLEGAKRIIALRGGPRAHAKDSEFFRFLLKWLAYFDVMSSMTNTDMNAQPLFEGNYWLKSHAETVVSEEDFKLDPYMGFLQDVVPYFLEIGRLTRETKNVLREHDLRKANGLYIQCRRLESSLKDRLGTVSGQAWMSPSRVAILVDCHDAFIYALMVHLYRRVEGLDSTSYEVRTSIILGLKHIVSSSQNEPSEIDSSLLFPLFTFGCEANTIGEREQVLDRLTALRALGLGNVDRAIDVLWSVWRSDPEIDAQKRPGWNSILRMFNWEVNLA